jgi:hypothetical protein
MPKKYLLNTGGYDHIGPLTPKIGAKHNFGNVQWCIIATLLQR